VTGDQRVPLDRAQADPIQQLIANSDQVGQRTCGIPPSLARTSLRSPSASRSAAAAGSAGSSSLTPLPAYQRRGLAAAGLAALRAEHPGFARHTLGGHIDGSPAFWNTVGADVPGGYRQRGVCPHISAG